MEWYVFASSWPHPPAQEPQCKDACARIDDGWGQDQVLGARIQSCLYF